MYKKFSNLALLLFCSYLVGLTDLSAAEQGGGGNQEMITLTINTWKTKDNKIPIGNIQSDMYVSDLKYLLNEKGYFYQTRSYHQANAPLYIEVGDSNRNSNQNRYIVMADDEKVGDILQKANIDPKKPIHLVASKFILNKINNTNIKGVWVPPGVKTVGEYKEYIAKSRELGNEFTSAESIILKVRSIGPLTEIANDQPLNHKETFNVETTVVKFNVELGDTGKVILVSDLNSKMSDLYTKIDSKISEINHQQKKRLGIVNDKSYINKMKQASLFIEACLNNSKQPAIFEVKANGQRNWAGINIKKKIKIFMPYHVIIKLDNSVNGSVKIMVTGPDMDINDILDKAREEFYKNTLDRNNPVGLAIQEIDLLEINTYTINEELEKQRMTLKTKKDNSGLTIIVSPYFFNINTKESHQKVSLHATDSLENLNKYLKKNVDQIQLKDRILDLDRDKEKRLYEVFQNNKNYSGFKKGELTLEIKLPNTKTLVLTFDERKNTVKELYEKVAESYRDGFTIFVRNNKIDLDTEGSLTLKQAGIKPGQRLVVGKKRTFTVHKPNEETIENIQVINPKMTFRELTTGEALKNHKDINNTLILSNGSGELISWDVHLNTLPTQDLYLYNPEEVVWVTYQPASDEEKKAFITISGNDNIESLTQKIANRFSIKNQGFILTPSTDAIVGSARALNKEKKGSIRDLVYGKNRDKPLKVTLYEVKVSEGQKTKTINTLYPYDSFQKMIDEAGIDTSGITKLYVNGAEYSENQFKQITLFKLDKKGHNMFRIFFKYNITVNDNRKGVNSEDTIEVTKPIANYQELIALLANRGYEEYILNYQGNIIPEDSEEKLPESLLKDGGEITLTDLTIPDNKSENDNLNNNNIIDFDILKDVAAKQGLPLKQQGVPLTEKENDADASLVENNNTSLLDDSLTIWIKWQENGKNENLTINSLNKESTFQSIIEEIGRQNSFLTHQLTNAKLSFRQNNELITIKPGARYMKLEDKATISGSTLEMQLNLTPISLAFHWKDPDKNSLDSHPLSSVDPSKSFQDLINELKESNNSNFLKQKLIFAYKDQQGKECRIDGTQPIGKLNIDTVRPVFVLGNSFELKFRWEKENNQYDQETIQDLTPNVKWSYISNILVKKNPAFKKGNLHITWKETNAAQGKLNLTPKSDKTLEELGLSKVNSIINVSIKKVSIKKAKKKRITKKLMIFLIVIVVVIITGVAITVNPPKEEEEES